MNREFYENEYPALHPTIHTEGSYIKVAALRRLISLERVSRILEVGCGGGIIVTELARSLDATPVGIDISYSVLRKTQNWSPHLEIAQAQAEQLPFYNRSFDVCVCVDLLEHLPRPEVAIREFARVAHFLLLRVPLGNKLTSRLLEAVGFDFRERQRRRFGHIQFFTEGDINQLLSDSNFRIIARRNESYLFLNPRNPIMRAAEKFTYWLSPHLFKIIWGGNLDVFAECDQNVVQITK